MKKKLLHVVFVLTVGLSLGGRGALAKNAGQGLPAASSASDICDAGLALNSSDPLDAAKAIDICKTSSGPGDWGLLSATWVMADGSSATSNANYALGHGIFSTYGSNVTNRSGTQMLALSSGTARRPSDPMYVAPASGFNKGYSGNNPAGFPKQITTCAGTCPVTNTPYDDAALQVSLRTPLSANGFTFNFKYYTTDYPGFVCSAYNDWFVAMLNPIPLSQTDGNIAFSPDGNPIRANDSLLRFCTPNGAAVCYTCSLGTSELQGTGYENYAASSWLTATAAVAGDAVITLRFAIYDSEDNLYDSTVLIDNFQWTEMPLVIWLPAVLR